MPQPQTSWRTPLPEELKQAPPCPCHILLSHLAPAKVLSHRMFTYLMEVGLHQLKHDVYVLEVVHGGWQHDVFDLHNVCSTGGGKGSGWEVQSASETRGQLLQALESNL